jgi:hypothetical protein
MLGWLRSLVSPTGRGSGGEDASAPDRQTRFRFPLLGRPVDGFIEELTAAPGDKRLSIMDAMARHGNLKVRRTAIASALRDACQRPKIRGYPPRIFISYRWTDGKWQGWVDRLVAYLRGRGFNIHLDREHLQDVGEHGIGIGKYVADIANFFAFSR